MVSGGAPRLSVTRTFVGIISGGGTPLPLRRTASSTTRTPSGRRWMSLTLPSTLRLNSGRASVGAARLAVRQATRPKPVEAATAPMASARARLPAGDSTARPTDRAASAGPTQSAGSLGSSK